MTEVKHIYYRGYARSCNYQCSYCPFSKQKITQRQLDCDRDALKRFVKFAEQKPENLTIMFVPYGEALIQPYYQQSMAYLTSFSHIKAVGAQTNLSFSIESLLEEIRLAGGKVSKLRLWCSYHPDMVSEDRFLEQCHRLVQAGISFCVGGVAVPENTERLKHLRSRLHPAVYLWLNRQDGLKRNYTQEEFQAFCDIDPLFDLQFVKRNRTLNHNAAGGCTAGSKSIFAEYNGDYRACNISRVTLGNLYEESEAETWSCKSSSCWCYLAWVHQFTTKEELLFGKEKYFRIPDKSKVRAFFFDLDGTLLDQRGKISEKSVRALEVLAKTKKLYLTTSRTCESAMKKCRCIARLLSGGIFAGGAYYYEKQKEWLEVTSFSEEEEWLLRAKLSQTGQQVSVKEYRDHGRLYKVFLRGTKEQLQEFLQLDAYFETSYERGTLGLTARGCHKGSGLQYFLQKMGYQAEEIVVVGNSIHDIPMMDVVRQSFCVPDGEEEAKKAATWVMGIEHLPALYGEIIS